MGKWVGEPKKCDGRVGGWMEGALVSGWTNKWTKSISVALSLGYTDETACPGVWSRGDHQTAMTATERA